MQQFDGTTILSVRRGNSVVIGGDGQVSLGNTIMKGNARKVRRLYKNQVIAGFAGGTADAFLLFELFEGKLEKHGGQMIRAAVELAKEWRSDRALRRLEALLCVANKEASLIISGNGDVIEPEDSLMAIGSGGAYAQAAARAMLDTTELERHAKSSKKGLQIAGDICVYTNQNHTFEESTTSGPWTALSTQSPMTPREITQELDKHIIGQDNAKRAVAIALRNRWRRQQVAKSLRNEITPKNILMMGPTGVGKTEIARRLARLANAPFIKVEATKFTEVGYVGRDVESIVRDLVDVSVKQMREDEVSRVRHRAEDAAEEKVLDALLPRPNDFAAEAATIGDNTRQKFRKMLREGKLDDKEIEIDLQLPNVGVEIMAPPGMEEMTNQLQGLFQNLGNQRSKHAQAARSKKRSNT